MLKIRRTLAIVSVPISLLLSGTRSCAQTPPPTNPPTTQVDSGRGGFEDRSPLIINAGGTADAVGIISGRAAAKLTPKRLATIRLALSQFPIGVITLQGQTFFGESLPYYTAGISYSDGPRSFDVGYQQIFLNSETGTGYWLSKDLSDIRRRYAKSVYHLADELNKQDASLKSGSPSTLITNVLRSATENKDEVKHPLLRRATSVDKTLEELKQNPDGQANAYGTQLDRIKTETLSVVSQFNRLAVSDRVSFVSGYRHYTSGEFWNAGLVASTSLLPDRTGAKVVPGQPGYYATAQVQYLGGRYRSASNFATSTSAVTSNISLYWQDRVPHIDVSDPNGVGIYRWQTQAGFKVLFPNGIDPKVGYNFFVRHRWLPNDYEATLAVGKSTYNQTFVTLSFGRSFCIKY